MGGIGITGAHELVHRSSRWQRGLGVALLCLVNFAHWGIEHVFGHHKNVGTHEDPATAQKDESVYHFWRRNYFRGLAHTWTMESGRLHQKQGSRWRHRVLWYYVIHLVVVGGIAHLWGPLAVLFWLSQSVIAIALLLTVDYIEHYGLVRSPGVDGRPEPVTFVHSWDTSAVFTNLALFNLGLHSHHHWRANVPYPELRPQTNPYQMPFGYAVMVPMALLPWIFRPLMNARLTKIQKLS
jgi:alkane 1-monooxygenase